MDLAAVGRVNFVMLGKGFHTFRPPKAKSGKTFLRCLCGWPWDVCAFTYEENCGMPEFVPAEARRMAGSCLFVFLASNETFAIYELDAE